jgi:glycosyltransferase involved in cell wall biosynthesis
MNRKLSIITINYNNLKGLKRTVGSVINQTWKEFEYIVIDGGSTDGSLAFIQSQSANIHYWVSEPDKGIYNAMNKGIAKATGEYLLFLNSGDHFYSDMALQENIKSLVSYDLIYFNIEVIGVKPAEIISYPEILRFSDMYFSALCHQGTFIKKELFDLVGLYDEDLKIVSDWKFMILALYKYDCTYIKINETISTYYLDGISSQMDFSEERKQVLNKYFNEYVSDYNELFNKRKELKIHQNYLDTNRLKMLMEIEKTAIGRKIVSIFFRLIVILFSKKKLKDIVS